MSNFSDNTNIPMYNDEKINKEMQKRKKQEDNERRKKEEERKKAEKKALKMSRFHITEIPIIMILSICFMIAIIGVSIYEKQYLNVIYSIIGIVSTVYIGKRLRFTFDETLNVLIWNITQTIRDFIDYRLKLDFFSGSEKRVQSLSVIFSIAILFLNSNNILYGLFMAIVIITYIISFANREFDTLTHNANTITLFAFFGLIVKTIFYSLYYKMLYVDFMNIILIVLFTLIAHYTKNLPIYEPEEEE